MFKQKHHLSKPWLYRYRSSPTFILLAVCVAIFNDVFLFGTIIPILPYALPERINVDYAYVQIYIAALLAAYGGALLIGSLLFGWIGDRLSRRHAIFLFGLTTLLSATAILALGRTIGVLILGRILQGVSAAVVWTSGLALLMDIFGHERYGEAVGYANTAVSVGTTSAPLLGGLVYSRGGYSAVSSMSAATVIFALVLALIMVEPRTEYLGRGQNDRSQNTYANGDGHVNGEAHGNGHVNSTVGQNGAAKPAINANANHPDPDDANEYTSLISGKQSQERRSHNRPAYLLLLRSGRVLAGMGGIFTFSFVMISLEGMIPLFVKDTFHWGSAQAALTFLSWILPGFLGPLAGKTSDRFGSRWIAIGGLLFAVPPLILMRLVDHDSALQKYFLCGLLSLVGFGFVWIQPACIADLSTAAGELKRDRPEAFGDAGASSQAFGLFVFSYSCGCLVGPTIAGILKAKVSWGAATLILACACVLACVPILFKTSTDSRRPRNSTPAV